jgi:hypothetical protein
VAAAAAAAVSRASSDVTGSDGEEDGAAEAGGAKVATKDPTSPVAEVGGSPQSKGGAAQLVSGRSKDDEEDEDLEGSFIREDEDAEESDELDQY